MLLPAHLIERNGQKRCSACDALFEIGEGQSLSRIFADHLRVAHKQQVKAGLQEETREQKIERAAS